jgi:hypothetical protein
MTFQEKRRGTGEWIIQEGMWTNSISLTTLVNWGDWIVSMTWFRIRNNASSQKTRG